MIQAELLVLGAAVIVGAVGPQIRSIGQQVHYAVLILWLGMVGSVMACAMVVLDGGFGAVLVFSRAAFHDLMMDTSEPGGLDMMRWGRSELCCVSMLAVSSLLGQVCINRAWQDPASGQVCSCALLLLSQVSLSGTQSGCFLAPSAPRFSRCCVPSEYANIGCCPTAPLQLLAEDDADVLRAQGLWPCGICIEFRMCLVFPLTVCSALAHHRSR